MCSPIHEFVLILPGSSHMWLSFDVDGSILFWCRNWKSKFSACKGNSCKTALLILANTKKRITQHWE